MIQNLKFVNCVSWLTLPLLDSFPELSALCALTCIMVLFDEAIAEDQPLNVSQKLVLKTPGQSATLLSQARLPDCGAVEWGYSTWEFEADERLPDDLLLTCTPHKRAEKLSLLHCRIRLTWCFRGVCVSLFRIL